MGKSVGSLFKGWLGICSISTVITSVLPAAAATLSLGSAAPVPGPYDIYNFTGAIRDTNNVYQSGSVPAANGTANDSTTYVAHDRAGQGQTFTTGSSEGGYLLTDIWIRHVGYTADTALTYWQMAANGRLTVRVTKPALAGTVGFVLSSETYIATGAEGWPATTTSALNGDGLWLHFELGNPVWLATNTTYGFDLTSVVNNNAFFEWLGTSADVLNGGGAYSGNTVGATDNALMGLVGDRVFLVQLAPQAHPLLQARPVSDIQVEVSWPATNTGYLLQTAPTPDPADAWTTLGLPAPASDGQTNRVTLDAFDDAAFFRLVGPHKDFEFQLSSTSLTVTQGLASVAAISVSNLGGFNGVVSLSVSNLPTGLTAWFNPASLKASTGTLTLDADIAAPPGTYTMKLSGASATVSHSVNLSVTVVADAQGAAYTWPSYTPNLNYNFTNEFPAIQPPTNILNDCANVVGTITLASNWFCFRYGPNMNPLVTSNAWVPMLQKLDSEFHYYRDVMGWPPDKRAKRGYYSAVYLYGSGLCTDSVSNTNTGGWQSSISYNGESWAMGLLSYYPVYCFDPACPYGDKAYQTGGAVHEMIHCVLADMPGCKNAGWFQEGGNTWLQGTADAQRSGNYSSMGWLSAGAMLAPFMPVECYSGWLQDDSFGGPSAEGVNIYSNSVQLCTWRRLLGGTQYGETFPHFMGEMVSEGSVAWIWRNCTSRVLEGLANAPGGLGEYQTRRIIREFRARQALCDFGKWSAAYKKLLNDNWQSSIGAEYSPYWINCAPWTARCYVITTNNAGVLTPEWRTLPAWSGANQIPLYTSNTTSTVTVNFTPLGTNLSCQLVYRATDGSAIYGKPVASGACSLTPPAGKAIRNNVVIAVICNTDYVYNGTSSRTTKFDYRIQVTGSGTAGVLGPASISGQWYQ